MISRFNTANKKSRELINRIIRIDDWLESTQLVCTKTDGITKYDFNKFTSPLKFALKIFSHNLMLKEAEDNQQELNILKNRLNNNYNPRNQAKIKEKTNVIESAKKFYFIKEETINAIKEGIPPYKDGFQVEKRYR